MQLQRFAKGDVIFHEGELGEEPRGSKRRVTVAEVLCAAHGCRRCLENGVMR